MFLIENDVDLLNECGYLKNDVNRLNWELQKIVMEQSEEYLDFIKDQGESIYEKILNK